MELSLAKLERPIPYGRYVRLQERLRARRREIVVFCEHQPVITGGVQAHGFNLLASGAELAHLGVSVFKVSRGGDYTAHEPGQSVIYPHVDLRARGLGLSTFFQNVLSVTQDAVLETWGIPLHIKPDAPGLYTKSGKKIASIGVMAKRFFTSSGIALNVSNNLSTFAHINPCGVPGLEMTTIEREGGDPSRLPSYARTWAREFLLGLEQSPALQGAPA